MTASPAYRVDTLLAHVGRDFGLCTPVALDQGRIDRFAECTGDDQWIHVDPERARRDGPFGGTIAHGLLVLSRIPAAHYALGVYPPDAGNVLNYGFDRVRFLAPVPAGARVVLRVVLACVEAKGAGRWLVRTTNTAYRADDLERAVMVADTLAMVTA